MSSRIIALLLSLPVVGALAEEGGGPVFVRITSGVVINYGAPSINRLKFAKVGLSVQVGSIESSEIVEYHLPLLKDSIIMMLSGYPEVQIRSAKGKEAIRVAALEKMQTLMEREEGDPVIEEVLFDNFVIQR